MIESPYKKNLRDSIALRARKQDAKKGRKDYLLSSFRGLKTAAKETYVKKSLSTSSNRSHKSTSGVHGEECLYYGKFYSVSNDGSIDCQKGSKWAHNKCAGVYNDHERVNLFFRFSEKCRLF